MLTGVSAFAHSRPSGTEMSPMSVEITRTRPNCMDGSGSKGDAVVPLQTASHKPDESDCVGRSISRQCSKDEQGLRTYGSITIMERDEQVARPYLVD